MNKIARRYIKDKCGVRYRRFGFEEFPSYPDCLMGTNIKTYISLALKEYREKGRDLIELVATGRFELPARTI